MRSVIWDVVQVGSDTTGGDLGRPVNGATVNLYEWGTTTPISQTLYATPTSQVPLSQPLTTDNLGRYEVWVNGNGGIVDAVASGGTPTITTPQRRTMSFTRDTSLDPVSVQSYGADPTGVIDSTAAIQAALDDGGTVVLAVADGDVGYKITSTLYIGNGSAIVPSKSPRSVRFIGLGGGVAELTDYIVGVSGVKLETDVDGYAPLLWHGAADTPMVQVRGPIQNVQIEGIGFDCRGITNCAVRAIGMQNSTFRQLKAIRYARGVSLIAPYRTETAAFDLRAYAAGDATPNSALVSDNGANGNTFINVYGVSGVVGAAGLAVGSTTSPTLDGTHPSILSESVGPDVSQCNFYGCIFTSGVQVDSVALALRYTDGISFYQCSFAALYGVSVEVPTGATIGNGLQAFPNCAIFYSCHFDNGRTPPNGAYRDFRTIGTWTAEQGLVFLPLINGPDSAYLTGIENYGGGITAPGWTDGSHTVRRLGLAGHWKAMADFAVGGSLNVSGTSTFGNLANFTNQVQLTGGALIFPVVQIPQADANTLDDYEEGNWTPSLGGAPTPATYTAAGGRYTKIGRHVLFQANIVVLAINNGSTTVISGLPFAVGFALSVTVGYFGTSATNVVQLNGYNTGSGSTITLQSLTVASSGSGTNAIFQNGTQVIFAGHYIV